MTESRMRRVGLRVVLAALLVTLVITVVGQQVGSTRQRQVRQITAANGSTAQANGQEAIPYDEPFRTENVDSVTTSEDVVSGNPQAEVENIAQSENKIDTEIATEVANSIEQQGINPQDEVLPEGVLGSEEVRDSDLDSPEDFNVSNRDGNLKSQGETEDNEDISDADTAIYDDIDVKENSDIINNENTNSDVNEKEHILNINLNNSTSDQTLSKFSWLGIKNLLNLGNTPEQEEASFLSQVTNNKEQDTALKKLPDNNLILETLKENSNAEQQIETAWSQSNNDTGQTLRSSSNIQPLVVNDVVLNQENVNRPIQAILSYKETPFSVNGINEQNYDDFEDRYENDDQEEKNDPFTTSNTGQALISNGKADYQNISPSVTNGEQSNPDTAIWGQQEGAVQANVGADQIDPRKDNINNTDPRKDNINNTDPRKDNINNTDPRKDNINNTDPRKDNINNISASQESPAQKSILLFQPLQQQQIQTPVLSNLSQRQKALLDSLLSPRLLDILLAQNLESSFIKQLPANLQYFIHQKIQRIDQDFDPLSSTETKTAAEQKTNALNSPGAESNQLLTITSSSKDNAVSENVNNFQSDEVNENNGEDFYAGDQNEDNFDPLPYEDSDETGITQKDNSAFTPVPDTAVYDNPRPLSEQEFALFRTSPHTPGSETTSDYSQVEADAVPENEEEGADSYMAPQENALEDAKEDETLSCPREARMSRVSNPVTALVAFSDSATAWVRLILEQLTGIQTDSIYHIMAKFKLGDVASVHQLGLKVVIETHMATDQNFDRAVLLIRNPFAVDAHHRVFRPSSVDWQKVVLWNHTFSTWLTTSSLPLHVVMYEDLVESSLSELMKLTEFLSSPDMKISYKCAMKVALEPPSVEDDLQKITGLYHTDLRLINQGIDYLMKAAQTRQPHIVPRLRSYKAFLGSQTYI